MKKVILILSITLIGTFLGITSVNAEPSWFPFQYPCDTEWIEGERYYCETIYSKAEFLSVKEGVELKSKSRRFCKMENGAFTALMKDGERGYLADDGDYELGQVYRLDI